MKKNLAIGILGLGVVGTGVVELLTQQKELIQQRSGFDVSIKRALIRPTEDKAALAAKHQFSLTSDIDEIVSDDEIDIVIEVMGKINPAKEFILKALSNHKHVVTANKDLIAQHGNELLTAAQANGCSLLYEASVAGGIPILRTLQNSFTAETIHSVSGILNGTTNYMLTQMDEAGLTYDQALQQATELGFAESDPTNDVDGFDAAYKTVILTRYAYQQDITMDKVAIAGIRSLTAADVATAGEMGYEIKLIGQTAKYGEGVFAEVSPMLVPKSHPLASVRNENNAVYVKSSGIGSSMYYGPGAGSYPTAASIVADVMAIVKNTVEELPPYNPTYAFTETLADPKTVKADYYLAFATQTAELELQIIELTKKLGLPYQLITLQVIDQQQDMVIRLALDLNQKAELLAEVAKQSAVELRQIMKIMEEA